MDDQKIACFIIMRRLRIIYERFCSNAASVIVVLRKKLRGVSRNLRNFDCVTRADNSKAKTERQKDGNDSYIRVR